MWHKMVEVLSGSLHMERITDRMSGGIPDIIWKDRRLPGRAGWIELKDVGAPPTKARGKQIGLRPDQSLWMQQWARDGGLAGVLVKCGRDDWRWMWAQTDKQWLLFSCQAETWRYLKKLSDLTQLIEVLREGPKEWVPESVGQEVRKPVKEAWTSGIVRPHRRAD